MLVVLAQVSALGHADHLFFFLDHTLAKMCQFSVSTNTSRFRVFVCCMSAGSAMAHIDRLFLFGSHMRLNMVSFVSCMHRVSALGQVSRFFVWIIYKPNCDPHIYMGWLWLVGSFKLKVSFAKEPYERDYILQKRPIFLRTLLIIATPYTKMWSTQNARFT